MKFLVFDVNGLLSSRLIEGVCDIPEGAVQVDEALWLRVTQETDGHWSRDDAGRITKQPFPERMPDYPREITAARYRYETSGITVDGVPIDTGRDSQALITGATLSAIIDPAYVCSWKTPTGWVQLAAPQLISIATAVRAHVQACYDRESVLLRAVSDGDFEPAMLDEGWPA